MSRTNKTLDGPVHPCKLWLQWSSDGSLWKSWDKETSQNKFYDPKSVRFIVLDVLSTVTGFNDKANKGYYSNEVRNLREPFRLMCGGQLMGTGVWQELKQSFPDAKFTSSVYAMAKGDEISDYSLVNLKLSGASLSSWIEFVRQAGGNRALYENIVVGVPEIGTDKKGKVEYSYPIFQIQGRTLSDEAAAKADELDISLQHYLENYFNNGSVEEVAAVAEHHVEQVEEFPVGTDLDSLPF